jgi:tRNA(fMet)-specific endonuclease VapC
MTAFDAEVLTRILAGERRFSERARSVPIQEQTVPIVVVEEIVRGRLNSIRQAETGTSTLPIERAYKLFEETLNAFRQVMVLPHTVEAEALYQEWREQGIRVGTHDLRIAATCVVHRAKLVTCNRRDFEGIPGLSLEIWT